MHVAMHSVHHLQAIISTLATRDVHGAVVGRKLNMLSKIT